MRTKSRLRYYDNPNRDLALKFLRTGTATLAEIAPLAGVTRQAVQQWAVKAKINAGRNRSRFLASLWKDAQNATKSTRSLRRSDPCEAG